MLLAELWRVAGAMVGRRDALGLRSAAMTRAMRKAWRSMTTHSLRRGLSLVPLQAAWHRWRRGLAGAAQRAESQRQRQLRATLAAWKRCADGADVRLNVSSLEGRSAPLVLSRRVTQAQLHALLARLHKVAPWVFRLWWLKPDALVPTLLAVGAQTLRAAGLQSGAQIKMRLEAPVRGGVVSQASVHSKPAVKRRIKAQSPVAILSQLDERLVAKLEAGDIRLLRVKWVEVQPDGYSVQRRQELEALQEEIEKHGGLTPLLGKKEAADLVRSGKREAGALSYGWILPWDPDPTGERTKLLRQELSQRPYIKGLFWDQATLYQPPRTEAQQASFERALEVMMDLFASAVGTT